MEGGRTRGVNAGGSVFLETVVDAEAVAGQTAAAGGVVVCRGSGCAGGDVGKGAGGLEGEE